jgi:hypothetical protein
MPGTRQVYELDPEVVKKLPDHDQGVHRDMRDIRAHRWVSQLKDKSLVHQFLDSLDNLPPGKQPAEGYAVAGKSTDALKNATSERLRKHPSLSMVPEGEVTLVFFAHQPGPSVYLQKISRISNQIDICYRVKYHEAVDQVESFALIPLGKLSAGEYMVEITPAQEEPATDIICKPFTFTVEAR